MEIYTSYYANVRNLIKNNMIPVAISVGIPKYFHGDSIPYLAPTRAMLKMNDSEYIKHYQKILDKVDLDRLRDDLLFIYKSRGEKDIALLCYEKPGEFCHRRLFAEWLKEKTGYEVKEYGYTEKKGPDAVQRTLF